MLFRSINEKNSTYSPLSLYFIIDNEIETSNEELNRLFDLIINETKLDLEIKNLIIYKKGLFNSEFETENNLIKILKPIISSDSVWKSHALYLMAEYFYDKNQKQKAKEFYNQILNYKKSNENILIEAQIMLEKSRYSMLKIPFGWYVVDYSDELKPGDVKAVRYFAQDQVLFIERMFKFSCNLYNYCFIVFCTRNCSF